MEVQRRKRKQAGMLTTTEQHKDLQPIDDDFMRCLFKDNISLAEFVLRIITDKQDIVITACKTQKDMKRLAGHVLFAWMHLARIRLKNDKIWIIPI